MRVLAFIIAGTALLAGCSNTPNQKASEAEIQLGAALFADKRLSKDGSLSCATCHDPARGFTDGQAVAVGIHGAKGTRNTPTIYGVANQSKLFWDGRATSLEEQAMGPLTSPVEMAADPDEVIRRLAEDEGYLQRFKDVFGGPPTVERLTKALASFQRAVKLEPSPFDRWRNGETNAISEAAKRGYKTFSQEGKCSVCHRGTDLTDGEFHNLGVALDPQKPDLGRFAVTQFSAHRGAFKTPTLYNVALTAPYMHDGSLATLEEVVAFYDQGGGPDEGRSALMRKLNLTVQEKADLVEFLKSLNAPDNSKTWFAGKSNDL
jgi:cytochrome c peroxidase